MKVLVLGPVLNEKLSGGVGTFDENLVQGFRERGDEANIISLAKSSHIDNIVIPSRHYNDLSVVLALPKIAKAIAKEKPDLVISSLQYNLGIKLFKRKWPKAKYIAVLHGVTCPTLGKVHSALVNFVARYSQKHFDSLVIVSSISLAFNWMIFGIKGDASIPIGFSTNKDVSLIGPADSNQKDRPFDFLYVGRLVADKNIIPLCRAFLDLLKIHPNLILAIAGWGELEDEFLPGGEFCHPNIKFFGKLPHEKTFELYKQAKTFISLHPVEAYGLAFGEAALCGCNLVGPISTGILQVFYGKQYFHIVDISSVDSIKRGLENCLENYSPISDDEMAYLKDELSVKKMADRYAALAASLDQTTTK